jgi:hypothetical protein
MDATVAVKHKTCDGDDVWTIENEFLRVRLTRQGLGLSVTDKRAGKTWRMEDEKKGFLVQKYGRQLEKPLEELNLNDWREAREGDFHGVELRSVQPDPWRQYNLRLRVLLAPGSGELRLTIEPHEVPGYNGETWMREIYYPRSFVHGNSPACRTVIPFQQGTLLPGDWPQDLRDEVARRLFRPWGWEAVTGPWWGHVDESGAGYTAILDTPDDAEFDFDHPAGGPTRIAPYWTTSWEAFRYARTMIYRFFPEADHVKIALAYRDYCQKTGRWRSIEEKRLEKPQIDKLRGAVWLRLLAFSIHLGRDPIQRRLRTFDEICETVDRFAREHPDENVNFILAAWQTLGYDHAHPAAVPPNAEAGGWEGMRRISEMANKHGLLFGTHEQYRDFFLSSPFWSEERTRKDSRRDSPHYAYWAGGTQSVLCPSLMLDFLKMNVQQLIDQKIKLNATIQDVLTAIPLEECYDPNHPLTRTQCREARYSIFEYYRQLGWVISSESASDWAAPGVDDCAIMQSGPVPPLLCALAGANSGREEDRVLRRLHKHIAYMPLTGHRLLSDDGTRQESVFGDSVTVAADLDAGTYRITGLPKAAGLPEADEVTGDVHDDTM